MQSLLNELRANTRLRLGIWLILIILLSYTLLLLDDHKQELIQQYANAQAQLNKLETIAEQKQWQQRQAEADNLRLELDAKLWQASSQGLARADFQAWLSITLRHTELSKARLKVENIEVLSGTPKLWKVSARIDGAFKADPLMQLLRDISKNPKIIVVDHLDIPANGSKRFSLQISAYFQANAT